VSCIESTHAREIQSVEFAQLEEAMANLIRIALLLSMSAIACQQQPATGSTQPQPSAGSQQQQPASGSQQQQPGTAELPSVQLPPEIARVLTDYEAAWTRKDAAALALLFAEDGFVLPSGRQPVRGRAAVQQYYTGQGGTLALRAFAYAMSGDVGYILGGYAGSRNSPDEGKFTLTLRKGADRRWLIVSDMDNSNRRQ
jgi:ketosteroid isomerase-like protein